MKSAALILAACLALTSTGVGQNPVWERLSLLDKEDLRSAAFWIQKKDPSAERFTAFDKLPIDSTYSVLLVSANMDSLGVFVVYGRTNQVYIVLDILPLKDLPGSGQVQEATTDSVLLEFLADYGSYHGTLKYVYDLSKKKIHSRPFALEGSTLWFANDFYDGEGSRGVGAIGSFDLRTLKYELRHSPEIAPWAGSAILVEKDAIWVGLMHNPEGAAYGGGLVRYDRNTGLSRRYDLPGLVYTIDRMGGSIYLGTSYGLYVLRTGELTQYRFEPVSPGNWGIVARPLL